MITERLFSVFDGNCDGYLNSDEFISNLLLLYSSEFLPKLKLVFCLYDFDGDNYISKEDVRLILSYVPIKSSASEREEEGRFTSEGGGTEEFIDRVQSQFELETLLNIYFKDKEKLSFDDFSKAVRTKASEIFICLYSVLKSNLPSLATLKRTAVGLKKETSGALCLPKKGHRIAIAKVLNKFIPTSEIVKSSRQKRLESPEFTKGWLSARTVVDEEKFNEIQMMPIQGNEQLFCECGQPIQDFERRLCKNCLIKRKGTRIEGYLMKPTRSKSKLDKFWIAIEHQEIYCYPNKLAKKYKCVHSLLGCIVKEEVPELRGKTLLYAFVLCFANKKEKKYYAMSKLHLDKWLFTLRKNTNHADIEKYYIIKVSRTLQKIE